MEGDGRVMKITCLKKEKNLEADTLKSKERNELSFFSGTMKITTEGREITPPRYRNKKGIKRTKL